MGYPLIRYALDPTGHNPNNLVIGEVHTLSTAQVRAVAPIYGPFFAESIVVYDHGTNVLLTKDVDYQLVHLLQDASLTFGKEICQIILITNRAVSNQVRLNVQVLGGNYQNSAKAISDAYDTFASDNRPVDWVNGVLNKQTQYTPSLHMHLLEDVVGFGALVVALERIGQAITLSNIPAWQNLVDWVTQSTKDFATEEDMLNMVSSDKLLNMEIFLKSLSKYNFNAVTFRPSNRVMNLGGSMVFRVESTNFNHGEMLFWTVEHDTSIPDKETEDSMFGVMNGVFSVINQSATFIVPTLKRSSTKYGDRRFHVKLHRNSVTGPVIADSGAVTLVNRDPSKDNPFLTLRGGLWEHVCCLNEPGMVPSPEAMYLVRETMVD